MNKLDTEIEQLKITVEKLKIKIKTLAEINTDQNLKIKYLEFDVEATNREKMYFKKLLDKKNE